METSNTFEAAVLSPNVSRRIKGAACNIARTFGADPDDVEQEMVLAILERDNRLRKTGFLDQSPAYIVNYGAWRARDFCRHNSMVPSQHEIEDDPLYPDGAITFLDNLPDDPWETAVTALDFDQALEALDEQTRGIAWGLAAGHTVRGIGEIVGCSRTTVSTRKPRIAAALTGLSDDPIVLNGGTQMADCDEIGGLSNSVRDAADDMAVNRGLDADDAEWEMVLAILERYIGEPAFVEQPVPNVVGYGICRAWSQLAPV